MDNSLSFYDSVRLQRQQSARVVPTGRSFKVSRSSKSRSSLPALTTTDTLLVPTLGAEETGAGGPSEPAGVPAAITPRGGRWAALASAVTSAAAPPAPSTQPTVTTGTHSDTSAHGERPSLPFPMPHGVTTHTGLMATGTALPLSPRGSVQLPPRDSSFFHAAPSSRLSLTAARLAASMPASPAAGHGSEPAGMTADTPAAEPDSGHVGLGGLGSLSIRRSGSLSLPPRDSLGSPSSMRLAARAALDADSDADVSPRPDHTHAAEPLSTHTRPLAPIRIPARGSLSRGGGGADPTGVTAREGQDTDTSVHIGPRGGAHTGPLAPIRIPARGPLSPGTDDADSAAGTTPMGHAMGIGVHIGPGRGAQAPLQHDMGGLVNVGSGDGVYMGVSEGLPHALRPRAALPRVTQSSDSDGENTHPTLHLPVPPSLRHAASLPEDAGTSALHGAAASPAGAPGVVPGRALDSVAVGSARTRVLDSVLMLLRASEHLAQEMKVSPLLCVCVRVCQARVHLIWTVTSAAMHVLAGS